ncbi:hypothetical protein ABW21_db0207307 [Orbilia brochopaga]|nr:hypothetical protein ABW21_db0207307 [Drechslerella brochopaga]
MVLVETDREDEVVRGVGEANCLAVAVGRREGAGFASDMDGLRQRCDRGGFGSEVMVVDFGGGRGIEGVVWRDEQGQGAGSQSEEGGELENTHGDSERWIMICVNQSTRYRMIRCDVICYDGGVVMRRRVLSLRILRERRLRCGRERNRVPPTAAVHASR